MVSSIGSTDLTAAPLVPKVKPVDSASSFPERLSILLRGLVLTDSGLSPAKPSERANPGQNLDDRQNVVASTDSPSRTGVIPSDVGRTVSRESSRESTSTTSTPAKTAAAAPVYTLMGIPRPPAAAIAAAAALAAAAPAGPPAPFGTRLASGKVVTNEYEAYWATQPPAVQVLMKTEPEYQRTLLAHDLADQGYLIDVPIMIWGWDPLATMTVRRNQGFTWVPSANMEPVRVAPGLTFAGLKTYDPQHPPAGAITVSTDFAKGFEKTAPWQSADSV